MFEIDGHTFVEGIDYRVVSHNRNCVCGKVLYAMRDIEFIKPWICLRDKSEVIHTNEFKNKYNDTYKVIKEMYPKYLKKINKDKNYDGSFEGYMGCSYTRKIANEMLQCGEISGKPMDWFFIAMNFDEGDLEYIAQN